MEDTVSFEHVFKHPVANISPRDYRLIVERRSAFPNDLERYAGGNVSSW
jgi:hypothetical protein